MNLTEKKLKDYDELYLERKKEGIKKLADIYHQVFSTSEGKEVLDDLYISVGLSSQLSSYKPEEGTMSRDNMIYREGQKSVYNYIKCMFDAKERPYIIDMYLLEILGNHLALNKGV
ncbi:MAG: hypothetical protein LBI26_02140 [Holosporales bacterium]|jgi:hypothetical protein|nr:hypothetical protein [Holosporales bacterium]